MEPVARFLFGTKKVPNGTKVSYFFCSIWNQNHFHLEPKQFQLEPNFSGLSVQYGTKISLVLYGIAKNQYGTNKNCLVRYI